MASARKVIITCAVTGSIHTPTMTPYLPITPDDIAREAVAAAEAGAAILHLHARDPKDGRPTPDPAVFMEFLPRIKQACDAVVNVTTGGGHGMSLEERLAGALRVGFAKNSFERLVTVTEAGPGRTAGQLRTAGKLRPARLTPLRGLPKVTQTQEPDFK